MPKKERLFYDTKFNEWLINLLLTLPRERLDRLNDREIAKIRSKTAITQFVNNAKSDEIDILLSKIGLESAKVYFDLENFSPELIKKAYRQYSVKDLRVEVINEMLERKMFVTDSSVLAQSLAMMSMNCHSDVFEMNSELRRATAETGNYMKKKLAAKNMNQQLEEAQSTMLFFARFMTNCLSIDAYMAGRFDLQPADLMILSLLVQHPNNFVSASYLKRNIAAKYKASIVAQRCGYLLNQKKYIDKLPAKKDVTAYRITSAGILAFGQIMNHALSSIPS